MDMLSFIVFDPMYFIIVGPAILFALIAEGLVKSAYATGNRYQVSSGLTGAQTAQRILDSHGINTVGIEQTRGVLGDHYDPKAKVLRLSPDVFNGRTLSAVGIAAHEVGHAIQDKTNYSPLVLRNGVVPLANIGSKFSFGLIFVGLLLSALVGASFGMYVAAAGVGLFGVVVLFQLINLPVEFNASSRAREILLGQGIITDQENHIVGKVLNAAALTYVAATMTAVLQMLYFAMIVFGGRRD
ncbi:MAG: zinc metallopeptidase [Planctomycetota bacterium]|jgi:Zn-dependent membrane protease YugP